MQLAIDVPDEQPDKVVMLALPDILPFVARVIRADALLRSLSARDMIALTDSRAAMNGIAELQGAVEELTHPRRYVTLPAGPCDAHDLVDCARCTPGPVPHD